MQISTYYYLMDEYARAHQWIWYAYTYVSSSYKQIDYDHQLVTIFFNINYSYHRKTMTICRHIYFFMSSSNVYVSNLVMFTPEKKRINLVRSDHSHTCCCSCYIINAIMLKYLEAIHLLQKSVWCDVPSLAKTNNTVI